MRGEFAPFTQLDYRYAEECRDTAAAIDQAATDDLSCAIWNPYLGTAATSATRAQRAARLRAASREAEARRAA